MAGGLCVHEIPFRFDLMQLLLRCQRMQTSFVLLTRGGLSGIL